MAGEALPISASIQADAVRDAARGGSTPTRAKMATRRPLSAIHAREGGWHGLLGLPNSNQRSRRGDTCSRAICTPPPEKGSAAAYRLHPHTKKRNGHARTTTTSRWPDDELLNKLVGSIENQQQRRLLESADPLARRKFLGMLIAGSLALEWRKEIERLKPSDEEIRQFFLALDPERREEVMFLLRRAAAARIQYASQKTRTSRSLCCRPARPRFRPLKRGRWPAVRHLTIGVDHLLATVAAAAWSSTGLTMVAG
jgi:hypothetical protein